MMSHINGHDISIIMALRNASQWLLQCLKSIECQTYRGTLQLSVFNDGSTDDSIDILKQWSNEMSHKMDIIIDGHSNSTPKGVGYAKNRAVENSNGKYLCFMDADDVMMSQRIVKQLEIAKNYDNAIVGCKFIREPKDSTIRYTHWANNMTPEQLYHQIYTSHGPTLIMPSWFCSRHVYDNTGGFSEEGKGTPEDLIFFYRHLDNGGVLLRVDDEMIIYRYHSLQTSFNVSEETIWNIRLKRFEEKVLRYWDAFTIWSVGKEGRKFYRSLSEENRNKVIAFCDVSSKKINKKFYTFEYSNAIPKPRVPIIHIRDLTLPIVICVKLGLTFGQFEDYLSSLNIREGIDYYHFG